MKIGYLEPRSWDDGVRRDPHYYGMLRLPRDDGRYEDFNVERELNRFEAGKLNEADDGHSYSKGDVSGRFLDEDSMLETASNLAREHGIELLIEGSRSTLSPQRVVYGPSPLAAELNELWRVWDNDPDEETERRVEREFMTKMKAIR